ncbi:esterase-like activity of phytase-domain-containing protein [Hypoxylon trugodes]|uniref:esterase-like activity of phytase-domain-containing protein n=1 Tax=Hypoxylon trugodes TaxID=326681 RepID=UPI0021979E58|nr:esterase-like activity of phytase-domain-containing protein [Hypoxylon trugodes]KAI1387583.1 esterase-like activity of phytase-domain-containing protein [Hypoxylon trugodes]
MNSLLTTVSIIAGAVGAAAKCVPRAPQASTVNKTTCNGITYEYEELAGYGYVVSDAVDKFGDTLGGLGSSLHLEQGAWKKLDNGSYSGVLWSLPDRGWNTQGTINFNPRVHKFNIVFTPQPDATADNPSGQNLYFEYLDTILFSGPDGTPCTGLDADATGNITFPGFPALPVTTYTGDGFGGDGPGGKRIPVDSEGLWVNEDSSFWVSDEYGPYIYLFGPDGKMLSAIRPNDAIVPVRNDTTSFSANSPPHYVDNGEGDDVDPADPDSGRDNNHGFEGLSVSKDGKTLWVLLQAAAVQEGGLDKQTERYTRFLKYDVSNRLAPVYAGEWVVPLPLYDDPTAKKSKNPKVAAQSEILALDNGQFFVLSRDSNAGHGAESTLSVYRQIDVFDITGATDIKANGDYDCVGCNIAKPKKGELKDDITPATYCSFLDFNVNSQLNRFGIHNGGDQDSALLNEKWESLGLVPVNPDSPDGEYYVFSLSDNDFITQNGFMNGGKFPYTDDSGYNLDSQALVFKIRISS